MIKIQRQYKTTEGEKRYCEKSQNKQSNTDNNVKKSNKMKTNDKSNTNDKKTTEKKEKILNISTVCLELDSRIYYTWPFLSFLKKTEAEESKIVRDSAEDVLGQA